MMTNARRIGAMLLLVALLPATAPGQNTQHPADHQAQARHMMGGGMMMEGTMNMRMMSTMMGGPSPAMILKQSEALELGPDQVRELEVLQNQARMGRESRMSRMKTMHAQFSEVLSGDEVDAEEYEAVLRGMADQQVAMHVQRLKIGQQALDVLSDDQRGKLGSEQPMMDMGDAMMMGAGGMERTKCPMAGGEDEGGY